MSSDFSDLFKKDKHNKWKSEHHDDHHDHHDHHNDRYSYNQNSPSNNNPIFSDPSRVQNKPPQWEDYNDQYYEKSHYGHHDGHMDILQKIFTMLMNNKKLLVIAIVAVVLLAIVAIALLIALLPLIGSIIDSVNRNGIKGIVDMANQFLSKLWIGTGK